MWWSLMRWRGSLNRVNYIQTAAQRERNRIFFTWFKISNVSKFLPTESCFFSCDGILIHQWHDVRPVGLIKKCLENSYLHKRENVDLPLLTCPIRIAWRGLLVRSWLQRLEMAWYFPNCFDTAGLCILVWQILCEMSYRSPVRTVLVL